MNILASESGHYYQAFGTDGAGEPRYTIIGKNGNERPTTLRDAKKYGYVPSVTTITKLIAKQGLDIWKQQQVLMAALTLPRVKDELDIDFCKRVIEDSKEETRRAAERGASLHADIERYALKQPCGHLGHCEAVAKALDEVGIDIFSGICEHSFAHPLGYGGKIDWHNRFAMVDFKTKPEIEEGKKLAYPEHIMQLASYDHGISPEVPQNRRLLNVFVGINDEKVHVHEWTMPERDNGLKKFLLLLEYWKLENL